MAANTLLMQVDIPTFRTHFTVKRGHAWLSAVRQDCANRALESVDLTDDARWREYICSHAEARRIIGPGITHFEGRFCNGLEPNRHQLNLPPPFGHHRFDFICWRSDGTAVRLHPSRNADALPTPGLLTNWVITPLGPAAAAHAGVSTPSDASTSGEVQIHQRQGGMAVHHSRVDIISSEVTYRHLMDLTYEWREAGGTESNLRLNLLASASTPGAEWQWHRFLMGRPWGEDIFREGVTSLHLVIRGGQPALEIMTREVPFVRYIQWHGLKCRLC